MLPEPNITVLGPDPPTNHRLNANSFQQHALTSFKGWQYAVFYTAAPHDAGVRYVNVARRKTGSQNTDDRQLWQTITLTDYEQTTDDGHNTISLGICEGDGTLHLSFDLHSDGMRYRISRKGVATEPEEVEWHEGLFGDVVYGLLGLEGDETAREVLAEVTYPRFLTVAGLLFLELRAGKAGAGSDVLFRYDGQSGRWEYAGRYLVGDGCNPYVNGLSVSRWETLMVSWTNRMYVEYEDQTGEAHKQQAGPNGPENNAGLGFAMSKDGGKTWTNGKEVVFEEKLFETRMRNLTDGEEVLRERGMVADLRKGRGIDSRANDVAVDSIGIGSGKRVERKFQKGSGILNQEGQCTGPGEEFHVLMRDRIEVDGSMGESKWKHYWRKGTSGRWFMDVIGVNGLSCTDTGRRGKVISIGETLFFVLPDNLEEKLWIVGRRGERAGVMPRDYGDFGAVWVGHGFDGEPLVDEKAADEGMLSLMTRRVEADGNKEVVVLDWMLSQEDIE